MKIYVAGKFEDKPRAQETYDKLKQLGHSIAYDLTKNKPIKVEANKKAVKKALGL